MQAFSLGPSEGTPDKRVHSSSPPNTSGFKVYCLLIALAAVPRRRPDLSPKHSTNPSGRAGCRSGRLSIKWSLTARLNVVNGGRLRAIARHMDLHGINWVYAHAH